MMRPACIAACLAIAAVCAQPLVALAGEAPLPDDSVYHLDARLVDQSAHPLRFRDLRGKPRLVTMIYTQCQYVCPMIVDSVKAVERALTPAERPRIGFVLISMDPKRDTPEALQEVMRTRRLNPAAWTLLRPEEAGLRGIAGVLGVRYRALADGEFNHTTDLVLLDADGRILARSAQIGGGADSELLTAVRTALAHQPR